MRAASGHLGHFLQLELGLYRLVFNVGGVQTQWRVSFTPPSRPDVLFRLELVRLLLSSTGSAPGNERKSKRAGDAGGLLVFTAIRGLFTASFIPFAFSI